MPELPEVEIHARRLAAFCGGRSIYALDVPDRRLEDPLRPSQRAVGCRIEGVSRWGKYLRLGLGDLVLVLHLRMTGRVRCVPSGDGEQPGWYAPRARLILDDGSVLRFEDPRRFGTMWVAPARDLGLQPEFRGLGPDALDQPMGADALQLRCRASGRPIHALLMDQRVMAGLGNICALEILHRAGIAPARPARTLSEPEVRRLADGIRPYLEWAIGAQSDRELIYLGERGAWNPFTVYRRAGEACPRCAGVIERVALGGRGAYWCPGCQR